ncbi:hypothetical protein MRX96_009757 [Rhipicephalus microplus]
MDGTFSVHTGIDNVIWTTRPSCQNPYRPQVPFEAPTVTVFIGDSEVVSECDDEVEKTQLSRLCSLTKLKPSFQPKKSRVHHSQVSACSRAQPPNEPGSSRDKVGDHLREKTSTQLGASAPAQTVHYASSREAARNAVPGHTNVVLQVQKASALFAKRPSSFSAPVQNISDASRCKNHAKAKDGILAQAKTAMRQGGPSTQLGKLKGVSTTPAWDMRDFEQPTTSPSSGSRLKLEAKTGQSAQNTSSMLLKGVWNVEIYISPNTAPYDNARKPSKNAQAARKPMFEEHHQAVKPYLRHPVKQVRETLPPNKANNQQIITFNHHSAAHPRPAPPIKHKAYQSEKAYQKEEASYSCVTNILVDEYATD